VPWKNRLSLEIVAVLLAAVGLVLGSGAAQVASEMNPALISLDVKQMDLQDVLRLIAEKAHVNIIAGREVQGTVTLRLKNVDLWRALEAVLEACGYTYREEEGIIRVVKARQLGDVKTPLLETKIIFLEPPTKAEEVKKAFQHLLSASGTMEIDTTSNALIVTDIPEDIENIRKGVAQLEEAAGKRIEKEQIEKEKIQEIVENLKERVAELEETAREKTEKEELLLPERFQLNYIKIEEKKDILMESLDNVIQGRGEFFLDSLTNSVYVRAPSSCIKKVKEYFEGADVPPKRVMIKAEFVEVRLSALEKLGIRWRWKGAYENYPLGATFRYPYYTRPEPGEEIAEPRAPLSTLADAMGIIFGSAEQEFRGIINLLMSKGEADLLSSPNIVTLEGKEAEIDVGDEYPYETYVIQEGEKVPIIKFKHVGATLLVTPRIEGEKRVVLDIEPEVSEITAPPPFPGAPPIVGTRKARTQIAVDAGKTIVVGGLLRKTEKRTREGVPFLSRIPILRSLFSYKEVESEKTDLLVFITPHILPDEMEEENMVEKRKPLRVQIEELYQEGVEYKKDGQYEKARERFEELMKKSRIYGFSDYLKMAEEELVSLQKLEEERLEKERREKKRLEEDKIEKAKLEKERVEKAELRKKRIERKTILAVGLGGWSPSEDNDSLMIYEGQIRLKKDLRLFGAGCKSSGKSSYIGYFGVRIGDRLNLGVGGMDSSALEKTRLMFIGGFSLGTDRLRLEASYLYVPENQDAKGIRTILGIRF